MARPKKDPAKVLGHTITIRLSEPERLRVEAAAKVYGIPVREFVKRATMAATKRAES